MVHFWLGIHGDDQRRLHQLCRRHDGPHSSVQAIHTDLDLITAQVLGAFEAGFIPSLIVYLTTFYTRGELAKRVAAFYSCNVISGAFSG